MSDIRLTDEQRAAVERSGGQLLVSAAAGSGKTRVLVERLMRRIEAGARLQDFLVITYTNAAAAELRGKITDAIYERIALDPADLRLRREAAAVGKAKIGTIHSFCAGVIRENAHRLKLPPDFRVADEAEAGLVREAALKELLDQLYDSGDPDFYALADTVGAGRDDSKLETVILDAHAKLLSHPSPEAWVKKQLQALDLRDVTDAAATPWGRVIMDRARDAADYWAEQMEYLVDEAQGDPKLDRGYGNSFRGTLESLRSFRRALDGGWDRAREASAIQFPAGRISGYEDLKAVRSGCKKAMENISALFWDNSARALADMAAVAPAMRALFDAVLKFDERYAAMKRARGVLDFSDQEHMALKLLTEPETGEPTPLAREISRRFEEIMVDEYQDVNLIQETIFNAVSREGKNIFTVGDVKQSIYRFRLADPTIFLGKYNTFPPAELAGEGEPGKLLLTANFRSRPGILDAVNFIFGNVMSVKLGDLEYGRDESLRPGAPVPETEEAEVELDVLDMAPGEDGDQAVTDKAEAEAAFAARRILELVGSARIPDGEGTRPVRFGDVAVLMRSPRSALSVWQQVFAAWGVPLETDETRDFFAEPEVSLALSILDIIDNPRQDIPLISALKSPVWGFTAGELAEIRIFDREGDFWSALNKAAAEKPKCAQFLRELNALRSAAADESSDELLWHVYSATGLIAVVCAMGEGQERRENLMLLAELARTCEGAGYRGLFGFLTYVRRLREQGMGPETAAVGRGNAVRLMSIHKSKGLEFPVVILAGLTKEINDEDTRTRLLIHPELGVGPKFTDDKRRIEYYTLARRAVAVKLRQEIMSEELRVLYVAMTRPREKLIMLCAFGDAEKELAKLRNTPLPAPPELLGMAKTMAEWILMPALRRPESEALRFGAPNIPCDTGGDRWDVRLIRLSDAGAAPERREMPEIQSSGEPEAELPPEVLEGLSFSYPHPGAVSMPSKVTATELKGNAETQEAAEEAEPLGGAGAPESTPEPENRPGELSKPTFRPTFLDGKRGLTAAQKGTATHLVMQYADYARLLTPEGAAGEVERLRAMGTISGEQARAVRPRLLSDFFATEPGRLILGAPKLHRELKFSLLTPSEDIPGFPAGEKVLLQGVVDCCVEDAESLAVIDFKTDRVTRETAGERAAYYKGQLDAYALAMERVLRKPVRRRILCFLTAGISVDV